MTGSRIVFRLRRPARGEATGGFTIIELLISMLLLAIVSTTFLAATNSIYSGIHKQQGITNAADGNRRALELLDKQVRYASAINAPVTAADGNFYLEYQWSKSNGSTDTVTCSQWRLNPVTDVLQWRSWTSGTTPSPTPVFTTVDTAVVNNPATQPPFALLATNLNGVPMQYQELSLNLIASQDKGNVTTTSTLTALNTPNSGVPSTAVCQEVARS
jgi:prepilin-type N-terminal cleavage/methylation domain-containing protein